MDKLSITEYEKLLLDIDKLERRMERHYKKKNFEIMNIYNKFYTELKNYKDCYDFEHTNEVEQIKIMLQEKKENDNKNK